VVGLLVGGIKRNSPGGARDERGDGEILDRHRWATSASGQPTRRKSMKLKQRRY